MIKSDWDYRGLAAECYDLWFEDGLLVHTELRTHRLRRYHRHEVAMMLESVGFREVALQCDYTDSDMPKPEAEWIFIAKR